MTTENQSPQTAPPTEPHIALMFDRDGAGGYFAQLRVTGLRTEAEALAAVAHLQRTFCGEEIHVN